MRAVRLSLLFLLISLTVGAQFELGSVVGVVMDPQQAPVPGAKVEIRSLSTNVSRDVITSASGDYNSLPLQPGSYSITARHEGFRERSIQVTVGVSQRLQADLTLVLASVSGQVDVSAAAP